MPSPSKPSTEYMGPASVQVSQTGGQRSGNRYRPPRDYDSQSPDNRVREDKRGFTATRYPSTEYEQSAHPSPYHMGRDVNETAPGTQISVSPRSIYGNEQRKGQVPIESPTEQPGRSPKSNKAPMVNVSPPSYAFIGPPEDTPPEARPQTLQVSQEDDTKEEETETDVPEVPSFDRQTLMYTALGAVTVIGLSYFLLT